MSRGRKPHEIKPTPDTRICIRCNKELPLTEYQYSKYTVDNCHPTCRSCRTIQARERNAKDPEKHKKYKKEYYEANKWRHTKWANENKERVRELGKASRERATEEQKERRRGYLRSYRTQPDKAINHRISESLRRWLKTKNGRKWVDILGYDSEMLKLHIEALFEGGMSWDNMGEWHIDHYIPKSWFGKDEESVIAAWNIFNLQPKWAEENIRKSNLYAG